MTLEELEKAFADLRARVARLENVSRNAVKAAEPEIADDADLDGKYGNFVVQKDPPRWEGESYAGKKLSECSPEFLEAFAGFKDWQSRKDREKGTLEDEKRAVYKAKDAARARGWAKRLREQGTANVWTQPDTAEEPF